MDPTDRLLAALARLVEDVETVVASHGDLHGPGATPGLPTKGPAKPKPADAYLISTNPACRKAAVGPGAVEVGCTPASYPVPMAAGCQATSIVAGDLPGPPSVPVDHPAVIGPGETCIRVSIDPSLPIGLYLGALLDQTSTTRRPFAVYLDGLPG